MKLPSAVLVGLVILLPGCAQINDLSDSLFSDRRSENSENQRQFDVRKAQIETRANNGQITWVQAAEQVRDLDRSFAGRGTWVFDSNDEEYHAYCIAMAGRVDSGRLSVADYNALRTRKFNEIQQRRRQ